MSSIISYKNLKTAVSFQTVSAHSAERLPQELIEKIISYMSFSDWHHSNLISREWHQTAHSPKCLRALVKMEETASTEGGDAIEI